MAAPTLVPTRQVIDAIVAGLATGTGKNIGDGQAPDDVTLPYAVVYWLPGGGPDNFRVATLDHGHTRDLLDIQVSCYGSTAEQARWMLAKTRSTMLDLSAFTAPSGYKFEHVNLELPGGVSRDDDLGTEPVFQGIDRYRLWVMPT